MRARVPLPDPGPLRPFITSFELHLRSENKAQNTRAIYLGAATRLAGYLLDQDVDDWGDARQPHLKAYMVWLLEDIGYDPGYVNNQYRAIQAFWKWYAAEEQVPNPMVGMNPPSVGEKLIPVIEREQMVALVKDAEGGRDFESRRDAAMLRLFASSGARLSEITNLAAADIDLAARQARVVGKGNKERWIKFDAKAAQALDRYIRLRGKHRAVTQYGVTALWIGVRRHQGMTPSGVRQVIERRAERLGFKIHPHMFRHTLTHNWLDKGGAEGDLMELNGWTSAQMLRRYGASARSARARRAYDRIDVMDGV